jgi:hypothetical protein
MTGIDALCIAGMHQEGWYPGSRSSVNLNPGNLRASPVMPHTLDADQYCQFASLVDGVEALETEYLAKATGKNAHGIGPDSTLNDLYNVYAPAADHNAPHAYAVNVARSLTILLGRPITYLSTFRAICPELFS